MLIVGRKRSKIPMKIVLPNNRVLRAFCFPLVLSGLTVTTSAPAQTAVTNNPSFKQQAQAPALQLPATNLLVLSTAAGKVRVLDSKGLLLESNLVYLPRIKISDLSDAELHSLLETKKGYAALTSFGPVSERNAQSVAIENQLRQVWLNGKSLAEKIQTRLELLDEMRAYNADMAFMPGLMQGAGDADARADAVNDWSADKNQVVANAADGVENAEDARALGAASHEQMHDAWAEYEEANERAARADNKAIAANYQSAVANQTLQNYLNACAAVSASLAAYGINVPASPPFSAVPPLSMRPEVDAERMAGISSTNSSTTGQ
jgi:hypothetical protein